MAHKVVRVEDMEIKMENMTTKKETLFNTVNFPHLIQLHELKHIHLWVKNLFSIKEIPWVPLAGRLKEFIKNWQILTKDKEMLSIVEGYEIPFQETPQQEHIPTSSNLNWEENALIKNEIHEMLNKGAIVETQNHVKWEFIRNLFLVGKNDEGNHPVINLAQLNK